MTEHLPFFTVGHSNRSIAEFLELLSSPCVERIVDVRKIPMSRANPQFNSDALSKTLETQHIAYEHIAALGGLRSETAGLPSDINGFWDNKSFHNYADYTLSADFQAGLELLIEHGRTQRCAIMCSEAVWWRCHRRLIADQLIARGETVIHIMGSNRLERAHLTQGAVIRTDGKVVYPGQGTAIMCPHSNRTP